MDCRVKPGNDDEESTPMTAGITPSDAKGVEQAVQWALAEGKTLEIEGGGSKRAIGRPTQVDLTLDLSALNGVTLYEPEELVLSARAGTPLAEIEALVASKNQQLAFEPMHCGRILGIPDGQATIGGALASNLSGPRRIKAGAARDHFLGFSAISGRGETFKSGGRVVKNVTGYDLCKLMAGSWGTLAVMTDVTLKTLPKPETEVTVLICGLQPDAAVKAMTSAMDSGCDPSGAAHLPEDIARGIAATEVSRAAAPVTALRLEGFAPSVAHRRSALEQLLSPLGEVIVLNAESSNTLWQAVRDATSFAAEPNAPERPLWRISTAPTQGAALAARISAGAPARILFDWAGGLIWAALPASEDGGAALVSNAVAAVGGHATLVRAPVAVRAKINVFWRGDAALAALTKRVKESFDPKGVLNPGRMWAGV
jgi:glycolate oxidase FAD binding subunit